MLQSFDAHACLTIVVAFICLRQRLHFAPWLEELSFLRVTPTFPLPNIACCLVSLPFSARIPPQL